MPSSWVDRRGDRWIVRYRTGGRESPKFYGGSFRRRADADTRHGFIDGELAGLRVPDIHALRNPEAVRVPTVASACDRWRDSRIDVTDATRNLHRVALKRVTDLIGDKPVDEVTSADVADLVGKLAAKSRKRETIKKSVNYLAQVLDHEGLTGERNACRNRAVVRLPRERRAHIPPPLADHVEQVAQLLPREYVLPFLIIDWAGPRVSELETAQVGNLDEGRKAIRVRPDTRRTSGTATSTCPTIFGRRCRRPYPRGRTATRRRRCFPASPTRTCGWRSSGPAPPGASRISRRTGYAAAAGACTTSAPAAWPRWPSFWATRSGSRPSTTCRR
jgi:hypothetical protein